MSLSLKEHNAIAGMADVLYDFLPGSGHASWTLHVNFRTVAAKVGVADYWPGGSKKPAIITLLSQTLERNRGRFESLILEVVRQGIVYRQNKGNPVTAEDIDRLNGHILEIGFKFPQLRDSDFRSSLCCSHAERARQRMDEVAQREALKETARNQRLTRLESLKHDFITLHTEPDRGRAGLALERLLNELFQLFELKSRRPFRVVGEQIDGSFELDHETYLVEAKWEKDAVPEAPLLVFRGKIEGKSAMTRGVFIALNGISEQGKFAITQGKQPTFFAIDGHDLMMILCGEADLVEFLRQRQRLLADEGRMFIPFGEIWKGSRQMG